MEGGDDAGNGESAENVIDAKTMSPDHVAVVELPKRVPYGLHTFFVTENEMAQESNLSQFKSQVKSSWVTSLAVNEAMQELISQKTAYDPHAPPGFPLKSRSKINILFCSNVADIHFCLVLYLSSSVRMSVIGRSNYFGKQARGLCNKEGSNSASSYLKELRLLNDPEAIIRLFESQPLLHNDHLSLSKYAKALAKVDKLGQTELLKKLLNGFWTQSLWVNYINYLTSWVDHALAMLREVA